jgi:AcrR family transcriptional regulator
VSRRILPAPPGSVKDGSSRRSAVDAFADAPAEDDFAGIAVAVADADSEWPSAAAAAGDATGVARRTRRREARREAILRVAAPLFVRKGFAATSLDDVATALGLTRPAIYHYFTDKHQILLEIVERGFNNLSREARTIARGEGRAIDKLERIFHLHLSLVADDPQAIFLVIAEAGDLAPSARAILKRRQLAYETVLTTLFEEAVTDGDLARSNARLLIKGLVSLANWVYAWYDPRGLYRHEDIARVFWALFRAGAADPSLARIASQLDNDLARPRRRTQRSG